MAITPAIAQRQMEALDRGLVAVQTEQGVYLSWRFLGTDDPLIQFNVYRNGTERVNDKPIDGATNLLDAKGTGKDNYVVNAVLKGKETETSKPVIPWTQPYKVIQLNRPVLNPEVLENGKKVEYLPNDCSVVPHQVSFCG